MKTLSIVTAVESQILENAATVFFRHNNLTCTVEVSEEGFVGQVMNKYFGTSIRMHPVARNERGHFVSIKGYEDQLVKVGMDSGWIVKPQPVDLEKTIADLMAIEPVVQTPVSNVVEMAFGKVDKPAPITRVLGGRQLETPQPMVQFMDANDSYVDDNSQSEDFEPQWDNYEMLGNIVQLDPNHSFYEEHKVDVRTNDCAVSIQEIVKQACRIVYDYFKDEMYLKTINREQLIKQFSIIWNKNTQLHVYKAEMKYYIFDCIKYYVNEALGNRIFLTKKDLVAVVNKALRQSVQLSLAA